jgi:hypothetical protein
MADGDIWGSGRLSSKWLAVQSQLQADVADGNAWSQERSDLTGRAGAETMRLADRRPAFEALAGLVAMPDADPVARQAWGEDLNARWGTVDAAIAVRAATRARVELTLDSERDVVDVFWECYARTAVEYLEDRVTALVGLDGAKSALADDQVRHFARQLARGHEAKIVAPRRKAPPKPTEDVMEMVVG